MFCHEITWSVTIPSLYPGHSNHVNLTLTPWPSITSEVQSWSIHDAKCQDQRSVGSTDRVETNGRTDRADFITFHANAAGNYNCELFQRSLQDIMSPAEKLFQTREGHSPVWDRSEQCALNAGIWVPSKSTHHNWRIQVQLFIQHSQYIGLPN